MRASVQQKYLVVKAAMLVLAVLACSACATSMQATGEQKLPPSSALITPERPLPDLFFGCWEGTLQGFDSVTPLSFAGKFVSGSLRTTYQFCYRRVEGGGRLDLVKVEIQGKQGTVTRFDNHVTALDTERLTAHLKNHAVIESVTYVMWVFPLSTQQDIFAEQDIELKNNDVIAMRGKQLVRLNGSDIAEMTFHADFNRVVGT